MTLLLTLFAIPAAPCVGPLQISVHVNLDLPAMTDLWPTGAEARIESDIRSRVKEQLHHQYRYWCFDEAATTQGPRVELSLYEVKNEAWIEIEFLYDQDSLGAAKEVLWKPQELGSRVVLPAGTAGQKLTGYFSTQLLQDFVHQRRLRQLFMKHVPVAAAGQWSTRPDAAPSVVLPLPWNSLYKKLQKSRFRLGCWRSGHPRLDLMATGSPEPGCFPVAQQCQNDSYLALQVFPELDGGEKDAIRYLPQDVFLHTLERYSPLRLADPAGASQ